MFGGQSVRLFTLFGFDVKANASWLLLAALITWSLAAGFFPYQYPGLTKGLYWSLGFIGMIGLFFSLLFHEFSHSLVARLRGMKIGGITLFLFGGVAELTEEPPSPRVEFEVAAAGPLASFFLALVFSLIAALVGSFDIAPYWPGLFGYLGTINVILALFNLVPGYPLDGGRLLRAWLWHRRGDMISATRTASRAGQAFGLFLIFLGLWTFITAGTLGGMWWILIGFFVVSAARGSYQQLLAHKTFEGMSISSLMTHDPVTVSADLNLNDFVNDYAYRHHFSLYPVMKDGRLQACVRTRDVAQIPMNEWPEKSVAHIMEPCSDQNAIDITADAEQALKKMELGNKAQLLVMDGNELAGLVTLRDLLGHMEIRRQISGQ